MFRLARKSLSLMLWKANQLHVHRRLPITFAASIFAFPFVLGGAWFRYRLTGVPLVIISQAGFGHNIYETLTTVQAHRTDIGRGRIKLYHLSGCSRSPQFRNLYEGWKKYATSLPAEVEFIGLRCTSWVVLTVAAVVFGKKEGWLSSSSEAYSSYSCLTKKEAKWSFTSSTSDAASKKLDSIIESDSTFCIVGMREASDRGRLSSERNSSPNLYIPAIQHLLDLGFAVVRAGRNESRLDAVSHPNFFDYASSGLVSELLDLDIIARASFGIGDSYGLMDAVACFGSDSLMATYPLWPTNFISAPHIFFATRNFVDIESGREVTLAEIVNFLNDGGRFQGTLAAGRPNWRLRDQTPDEVLKATQWFIGKRGLPRVTWGHDPLAGRAAQVLNKLEVPSSLDSNPSDWREFSSTWWPDALEPLL